MMENKKEEILKVLLDQIHEQIKCSHLLSKEESEILKNLSESYCDLFFVFDYEKQNKDNSQKDSDNANIAKKTLAKLREENDMLKKTVKKRK